MLKTTTLQVPLAKELKSTATVVASEYGFSSLQEVVRLFLTKLAKRQLQVSIEETPFHLSSKNERRYSKMERDFEAGRNISAVESVDHLLRDLRS